jgi:hypothetical protein
LVRGLLALAGAVGFRLGSLPLLILVLSRLALSRLVPVGAALFPLSLLVPVGSLIALPLPGPVFPLTLLIAVGGRLIALPLLAILATLLALTLLIPFARTLVLLALLTLLALSLLLALLTLPPFTFSLPLLTLITLAFIRLTLLPAVRWTLRAVILLPLLRCGVPVLRKENRMHVRSLGLLRDFTCDGWRRESSHGESCHCNGNYGS